MPILPICLHANTPACFDHRPLSGLSSRISRTRSPAQLFRRAVQWCRTRAAAHRCCPSAAKSRYRMEIDAVQQQLCRVQPAAGMAYTLIDDAVVGQGGFPAHSTDAFHRSGRLFCLEPACELHDSAADDGSRDVQCMRCAYGPKCTSAVPTRGMPDHAQPAQGASLTRPAWRLPPGHAWRRGVPVRFRDGRCRRWRR